MVKIRRIAFLLMLTLLGVILFYVYRESKQISKEQTLKLKGREFWMQGRPIRILSGSIHYFRVPHKYWSDRLMKAKAMGLNTVTTYVPWNLHESSPGKFNFREMYDVIDFILKAKQIGLHVIVRPGPYICAELDFGGLPSWLLRDDKMKVRSMYKPFLRALDRYFDKLLPMLAELQANRDGPIIAFQIENEYGSYGNNAKYMRYLYKGFRQRGISELLITSDNEDGLWVAPNPYPDVLPTINGLNLNEKFIKSFMAGINPEYPLMVTEFWVGWYTVWGAEKKETRDAQEITEILAKLLHKGFSINIYMFHGGTNFGFTNGAFHSGRVPYSPFITSYDYDSPLTENGDITEKYRLFREVLRGYSFGKTLPMEPENIPTVSYGETQMHLYIPLLDTIVFIRSKAETNELLSMEQLPINNKSGQKFGYMLYRTRAKKEATAISIHNCLENQTGLIMVNNKHLHVLSTYNKMTINLPSLQEDEYVIDILYEGSGRVNYGNKLNYQRQKLIGPVFIDDQDALSWLIYPIEFLPNFLTTVEAGGTWKRMPVKERIPMFVKGTLEIKGIPKDTFADMSDWGKGVLFINQFNLGRYWSIGPQQSLYVPSNVLRLGINKVIIFETEMPTNQARIPTIKFVDKPIL